MLWVRSIEESGYVRRVIAKMKEVVATNNVELAKTVCRDKVYIGRPYDRTMYLVGWGSSRKKFSDDAMCESRLRKDQGLLVGWQNFELHEIRKTDRTRYYAEVYKEFTQRYECSLLLRVPTPPVYSYFTEAYKRGESYGGNILKLNVIRAVGESEHCVQGLMAFLRACVEGLVYNKLHDPRMYDARNAGSGKVHPEPARGRLTYVPVGGRDFVDREGFVNIVEGCDLDYVKAYMAYRTAICVDWSRCTSGFYYYDWGTAEVFSLLDSVGANGENHDPVEVYWKENTSRISWDAARRKIDDEYGREYAYVDQEEDPYDQDPREDHRRVHRVGPSQREEEERAMCKEQLEELKYECERGGMVVPRSMSDAIVLAFEAVAMHREIPVLRSKLVSREGDVVKLEKVLSGKEMLRKELEDRLSLAGDDLEVLKDWMGSESEARDEFAVRLNMEHAEETACLLHNAVFETHRSVEAEKERYVEGIQGTLLEESMATALLQTTGGVTKALDDITSAVSVLRDRLVTNPTPSVPSTRASRPSSNPRKRPNTRSRGAPHAKRGRGVTVRISALL